MPSWAIISLSLAGLLLLLALVAAVVAARRVALRAEAVLAIVEQELRPLIGQAHALTEDVRALTREAGRELARVGAVADRVDVIADGLSRFVAMLSGLTRAGQIIGIAAGLKKGVDVFLNRLRHRGGHHA